MVYSLMSNALIPMELISKAGLLMPSRREATRLREIEATAVSGRPDDGGATTRLVRWSDYTMKGLLGIAVVTVLFGAPLPYLPWPTILACSWVVRRIAKNSASSQAALRWDARFVRALRLLSGGGARLPDDLHRLRALMERSPVAVEVWRSLPPEDTLGMIRLAEQLVAAGGVQPMPHIELGGEASELASRVADALEAGRPQTVAPVLRLV